MSGMEVPDLLRLELTLEEFARAEGGQCPIKNEPCPLIATVMLKQAMDRELTVAGINDTVPGTDEHQEVICTYIDETNKNTGLLNAVAAGRCAVGCSLEGIE